MVISVILPSYNVASLLPRCINSLLAQTLPAKDFEIIIVDDGSPDEIPQLADEYARRYPERIRVVHQENHGLGLARNAGLETARGKYVAFIDPDDYIHPEMLARLMKAILSTDADAVFCGINIQDSLSGEWKYFSDTSADTVLDKDGTKEFLLDMIASPQHQSRERLHYMSVWHALYSLDLIRQHHIAFPSERNVVSEDIPFQTDFLLNAHSITLIPDALYYYCANPGSLSTTFRIEKFERYKNLYHSLKQKTASLPAASNRCARLFSGYTRAYLSLLAQTSTLRNLSKSIPIVRKVTNDGIWPEIDSLYPNNRIASFYQKSVQKLIIRKHPRLLLYLLWILNSFHRQPRKC